MATAGAADVFGCCGRPNKMVCDIGGEVFFFLSELRGCIRHHGWCNGCGSAPHRRSHLPSALAGVFEGGCQEE